MPNRRVELTYRGLLIGAAITLLFTAANVYAGLKVGLTFATTIPAAVISMALLRGFKNATIWENNIVQTVASAAGTLSAVIFVLPGLVMIGWWHGFPFLVSFGICAIGGTLGVMYSVPLRRALVTQSDLPYPEGVAAAEVLKVGTATALDDRAGADRNRSGLRALVFGSVVSAGFALLVATRAIVAQVGVYLRIGPATTGIGCGLSLLLVGVGHLIGLSVGLAILAGLVIAWGIATPVLTALHPMAGAPDVVAQTVWATQARFIGAGAIAIAAMWTLGRLARPVWNGLLSSLVTARRRRAGESAQLPIGEQDIPIGVVALVGGVSFIPLGLMFAQFLAAGSSPHGLVTLLVVGVLYVVAVGFLVAAACGYMAGLIGSSNSPVSGLAILAVLGISLIVVVLAKWLNLADPNALVAYALFVTSVLLSVATISNDNLQDLKTGQLVGATPWRQQVALIVGVVMGSLMIPPVLDLLASAYGFPGTPGHPATGPHPLPAPQATLISALAVGVITGKAPWGLIGAGVAAGIAIVALDELLRICKAPLRLPPLAVGLGIYLPATTTLPVVIGAVIGFFYNRWAARGRNEEHARQLGVLVASGAIVGESIFGVLYAGLVVGSKNDNPLGLDGVLHALLGGAGFDAFANVGGGLLFALVVALLYRRVAVMATREAVP